MSPILLAAFLVLAQPGQRPARPPEPPPPPDFSTALNDFTAAQRTEDNRDDYRAQSRFHDYLKAHSPNLEQKRDVYEAATNAPRTDGPWSDPCWDLVCGVRDFVTDEDVELIRAAFPRLSPLGKGAAIVNLTVPKTRLADQAVVDLSLELSKEPKVPYFSLGSFHHTPRNFDLLFPRVLQLAEGHPRTAYGLFEVLLKWAKGDKIPAQNVAAVRECALGAHRRLLARIRAFESHDAPDEAAKAAAEEDASIEGMVLDLLGHLSAAQGIPAMREAMSLKDKELRLWACTSLLQLGQDVKDEELADIASEIASRYKLLSVMREKSIEKRFPKAYRNNMAIAESHFWDWVETDTGKPPDKVEVAKTVKLNSGEDGEVEYFVFKFLERRKEGELEPGWEIGVSGPYSTNGEWDPHGGADTFSDFKAWDSTTAEAEVARIRVRLDKMRDDWAKMREPKTLAPEEQKTILLQAAEAAVAYQRGESSLVKKAWGDRAAMQTLIARLERVSIQREVQEAHVEALGKLDAHRKTEEEYFARVRKEFATAGRVERVDDTHVRVQPSSKEIGPGSFVLSNGKWLIDADAFASEFKPAEVRRWAAEAPVLKRMLEIYKEKGPYCWVPVEQLGTGVIARLNATRAGDAAEARYITDERDVLERSRAFLRAMDAHDIDLAKSQMTPDSAADPEVIAFLELIKVNHDGKVFMATRRGEAAKLAREDASRQPELEKKLDKTFAWVDGNRATALALFVFQTPGMTKDDADDSCTRLIWARSPKGWQLDGRGFVTFGPEGAAKIVQWVECVREAMREVETGKAPGDADVFKLGQKKYDERGANSK